MAAPRVEVLVPVEPIKIVKRLSFAVMLAGAFAAVGSACESAPAPRPHVPVTTPVAESTPPAIPPFDPATRHFFYTDADLDDPDKARLARLERNLYAALVLPIKPATAGDGDDVLRGLALADVLTRALAIKDRDVPFGEATFTVGAAGGEGIAGVLSLDALFTAPGDREAWLSRPGNDLPSGIAKTDVRWLVGGQLLPAATPGGPRRVFLWLIDRVDGKSWFGASNIDTPRLIAPRLLLLRLLTDAGLAPSEVERGDMVWTEELDDGALVTLGKAIVTVAKRAAGSDVDHAPVDALLTRAPWSYVAMLVVARLDYQVLGGCEKPVRERLERALSINPHADFQTQATTLACNVSELVADPDGLVSEIMQRRGAANCSVAGKAIAAIGGGREVPGSGFLAGLGGIYRNESCQSEAAGGLENIAEMVKDPFVAAGLYLDAGVGAVGDNALDDALDYFDQAIAKIASLPEPRPCLPELYTAEAHLHKAGVYLQRGQAVSAREPIDAAEKIGLACDEPRLVARAWNARGLVEQAAGQYAKALAEFERARDQFAALGDDMNLGVAHLNIGWTRTLGGQYAKALPDLEKAVAMKRRVRSSGGVAVALENLGVTLMTLGRFAEAEPLFTEALDKTREPTSRAAILNNLARIRAGQKRHEEARALLSEARALALRAHSRTLEAQIEQTSGGIEAERERHHEALDAFNGALIIRREVGDRAGEGLTLSSLMVVAARMGNRDLAIVYGKLAVAAHRDIQVAAGDKQAERDFLKTREQTYRRLAELLIRAGRLIEAERVLALLKLDEVNEWTRSVETGSAVPLTPAEKALEKDYQKFAGNVMAIGREYGALAAKFPLTPAESKKLESLRSSLEKANKVFGNFLASLADKPIPVKTIEDLREGIGIGPDLADLEPGTLVVYTLLTNDGYSVVVVSPDTQVAETVRIRPEELASLVSGFRRALQDVRSDPKPIAKELYDVLVAPIAKHIDAAQGKNILWSLDQSLRYVPIGALWDGERYLVERWGQAVFTLGSRARLKDRPNPEWRVLAAGVSKKVGTFAALPAVREELDGIVDDPGTASVDGILPGIVMLDDDFDKAAFLAQLGRRWPVVHIASHFAFEPGDKDASYLLLGKGELRVSDLENVPNLFQGVDILSLSACNTATGDSEGAVGKEVESFAVLAQKKGARAVLATLWPVADRSTSALMRRFYELHREPGRTKLAALRMAQLELLQGKLVASASEGDRGPRPLEATEPTPAAVTPPTADWTHPYYWAPFVLVGNTL